MLLSIWMDISPDEASLFKLVMKSAASLDMASGKGGGNKAL
jgi:hypothetical protein